MRRIAIIGGGIAGLTAAYELDRQSRKGEQVEAVLFESSNRLGGLIETVREGGFTVEAGPDSWVSAKPWARELAIELGLNSEAELIPSNDATRKTHIFLATPENPTGRLVPMPDGLNMMVPTNLDALEGSPLFTDAAIAAYRAEPERAAELLAAIPEHDESVADFTLRHFGPEVLTRVAAPLLSGVFGGDVRRLSVRAVMPAFVAMERKHGSLITALQCASQPATDNLQPATGIFTTLRTGLGTLIDRLVASIPPHWLRLHTTVTAIERTAESPHWTVRTASTGKHYGSENFDAVFLATPLGVTRKLLTPLDATAAQLLPAESSSAVLVAFAYADSARIPLPPDSASWSRRLQPRPRTQVPHISLLRRGLLARPVFSSPAPLSIRNFPIAFRPMAAWFAPSSAEQPPTALPVVATTRSQPSPGSNSRTSSTPTRHYRVLHQHLRPRQRSPSSAAGLTAFLNMLLDIRPA